jgi:hypothetical protein
MINFFWSLKRFIIKFQLNENVNEKKLIQSIQSLEEDNEYIKYEDNIGGSGTNKTLSFIIKNNILTISWSHAFYDMYSISFVLSKIDDIYTNKMKTYKFKYYKHSLYQFIADDIRTLTHIKPLVDDVFNIHKCDKKKYIKIPKSELSSPLSSSDIFTYILNKLNIDDYWLTVNLRKIYPEYVEQLGSLSSSSSTIHKNDNLQKYLKKLSRKTLEENLLKKHNKNLSITSLLNMKVASFIDEKKVVKDICDIIYYKETVIILPEKTDKKYVIAIYLH